MSALNYFLLPFQLPGAPENAHLPLGTVGMGEALPRLCTLSFINNESPNCIIPLSSPLPSPSLPIKAESDDLMGKGLGLLVHVAPSLLGGDPW